MTNGGSRCWATTSSIWLTIEAMPVWLVVERCVTRRSAYLCTSSSALTPPGSDSSRSRQFAFRKGPTMASSNRFDIIVRGTGGHAAQPHKAVDTIVIAAQLVGALQTLMAKNDRGKHVRETSAFKALASQHFGQVTGRLMRNWLAMKLVDPIADADAPTGAGAELRA